MAVYWVLQGFTYTQVRSGESVLVEPGRFFDTILEDAPEPYLGPEGWRNLPSPTAVAAAQQARGTGEGFVPTSQSRRVWGPDLGAA